jgi:uncharacterized membrane protein
VRGRLASLLGALLPFIILFVLHAFSGRLPIAAATALKLYPVAINLAFLASFSFSLWRGPSMIERLARLREPKLSPRAIAYTRQVTKVWCLFFVLNGSMALYSALRLSDAAWALYNGVIAYVLMGTLFGIEWLIRRRVKRHDAHAA